MANNEICNLKLIFTDILNNRKIKLGLATINTIIREELLINLNGLHQDIEDVILRMFVVYIRSWPGWRKSKDFFDGKVTTDEWFKRFKEYLNYKLKYILKEGYRENLECVLKENNEKLKKSITDGKKTEHSTQTDPLAPKGYSPFTMCIQCPPDLINTMVFTQSDNSEGNLVLHSEPSLPWEKISLKQLLNWPYVEVNFESPELKFCRRNVTDYKRYISFTSCPLKHESEDFLDEIDFFDKRNTSRTCYSYKFLESYCNKYLETLLHLSQNFTCIQKQFVQDVRGYLFEFLEDIKELNINNGTMATNTKVTFNIGKCNYVRVKKGKGNHQPKSNQIGYCEFITPKIELILKHFAAVQEPNHPEITFTHLNKLKNITNDSLTLVKNAVPRITFRCRFCQVSLDCKDAIYEHFHNFHKSERNVICFRCKVSFPLPVVTEMRWDHRCKVRDASSANAAQKK